MTRGGGLKVASTLLECYREADIRAEGCSRGISPTCEYVLHNLKMTVTTTLTETTGG